MGFIYQPNIEHAHRLWMLFRVPKQTKRCGAPKINGNTQICTETERRANKASPKRHLAAVWMLLAAASLFRSRTACCTASMRLGLARLCPPSVHWADIHYNSEPSGCVVCHIVAALFLSLTSTSDFFLKRRSQRETFLFPAKHRGSSKGRERMEGKQKN